MKLKKFLTILPFAVGVSAASANTENTVKAPTFNFSAQVTRAVEKDLMQASVYSEKSGKSLPDLKKDVSMNLNRVLEEAKKYPSIEVQAEGISNQVNYNDKGSIEGWRTTGSISLKSKDFEAMSAVLGSLGEEVGIGDIHFKVSPEKIESIEDEITLEIIKKFQHKADTIQKGLGAKKYKLNRISIQTPDEDRSNHINRRMAKSARDNVVEEIPLEAGKAIISATASGDVEFE